jgi:nucleotide-binding universal stress UspA family protein
MEGRTRREEIYAERVRGVVSAAAKFAGVACKRLHVEHEHVYQVVVDTASARKCGFDCDGFARRRSVSAVVLGSETVKVLTHSKTPVRILTQVSAA